MQAERIARGEHIDYTPSGNVPTGSVVEIGDNLIGIAERPILANQLGALATEGVFKIAKDASDIAEGNPIFWDNNGNPVEGTAGSGAATLTASGNKYLGSALADAGEEAQHVYVLKTKQPAITLSSVLTSAIADPGNAGAIPVTGSGYVAIVTAGSETRTLAAPTFVGQELLLYIKTDGGTCVITVASAVNQTGNNTITMADVRDVIRLVAIESGSNKVWHVASNDGAVLSTV